MTATRAHDAKYYPTKEVDPAKAGTHQQKRRPYSGWLNTCAAPVKPNGGKRPIRKARAQLAARMKEFNGKNKESGHVHHAPGSLQIR